MVQRISAIILMLCVASCTAGADKASEGPTVRPTHKDKPLVKGWAKTRVQERLDSGLIAMPTKDGSVYLGWRLRGIYYEGIAFNVYRSGKDGKAVKLNKEPIAKTTDFVDAKPLSGEDATYYVVPVTKGKEEEASERVVVKADADKNKLYYTSIKFKGDYRPQKIAIADLNGDGKYDFVIKQPEQGVDPGVGGPDMTGLTYKVEAYLNDGTFLWRKDLGQGIEPGIWWSPIVVCDLDGDGKAEVALKTAPTNLKREGGRIRTGPEWCSILDGMTGKETTWTNWPPRDPRLGDYNRINRNQLGIAYLDGKTPCLLVARGTYRLMMVDAYQYKNKKLTKLWHWEGDDETPIVRGQGAHTMTAADVDGDGRDEILLGSCLLDDNGTCIWSTGLGHPDNMFLTDIDPQRPGMEVLYAIENGHEENGICQVDALTGEVIWGLKQKTYHIGSGIAVDIDPAIPGLECWGGEDSKAGSTAKYMFSANGRLIGTDQDVPGTRGWFFWDSDLLRETTDRGGFNRNDPNFARFFQSRSAQGASNRNDPNQLRTRARASRPRLDPNDPNVIRFRRAQNRPLNVVKHGGKVVANGIEGRMVATADILGDWREEIVTTLPGELRVYTTTIPAADRRVCLMQDPIYRSMVMGLATGYSQNPVTGYYLGTPTASPAPRKQPQTAQ